LLYVCFLDPLHCGLESNPVHDGRRDGFDLNPAQTISSKGYADDTWVISSSVAGLQRMNDWVSAFCLYNHLTMNGTKTEMVGRDARTGTCMVNTSIEVAGVLVEPKALDCAIRYLGVHMNMAMQWSVQESVVTRAVQTFTHLQVAVKHKLLVQQAVELFNIYLIPRIEAGLRYINASDATFEQWDKSVVRAIGMVAKMPIRLNRDAVSSVTGLILPSHHARLVKVSETFIRLNSSDDWARSARVRWTADLGSGAGADRVSRSSKWNRLVHVHTMAELELQMNMRVVNRSRRLASASASAGVPLGCSNTKSIVLAGQDYPVVFGAERSNGWGTAYPKQSITVCSDGSWDPTAATSSWTVCYADDEFKQCYPMLPAEPMLRPSHLVSHGVCHYGASIAASVSSGIFMAELQGALQAISSLPATWDVQNRHGLQGCSGRHRCVC
jgi:hypothetical protein